MASKDLSSRPSRKGKEVARETSRNKYAPEIVDRALCALAYFNGNSRKASAALKAQGVNVPRGTLQNWPTVHADRYAELKREIIPKIHERAAEKHLELADQEMELSAEFIERMRRELNEVPVRDLSNFQRNLDTGSGIHTSRALDLRGQNPGAAVQVNVNLEGLIRSVAERGQVFYDENNNRLTTEEAIARAKGQVIEGSAEEESTPDDEGAA